MREWWTRDKTLQEFRKFVRENQTFSSSLLSGKNPYIFNLLGYHFGSYTKARELLEKEFSGEELLKFKEYWRERRRKDGLSFLDICMKYEEKRNTLTEPQVIKISKEYSEFWNCQTKRDLSAFIIRAFSEYRVEVSNLERKLWSVLSRHRRSHDGAGFDGEAIDTLEYSASGLYGSLGEALFGIYAKRKKWDFMPAVKFVNILKDEGTSNTFELYRWKEVVQPIISLCFEKILKDGYGVLRRGIPDFVAWEKYGFEKKPFFVEVKSNKSNPSIEQRQMFKELSRILPVFVFRIKIPETKFEVNFDKF